MTELVVAKTALGMAAVPFATLAAIDPSMQVSIMSTVNLLIATTGALITAWIAFKHAALKAKVDQLEKNTNGLKEALVASTAKENLAAGKLAGAAEAKAEAAIVAGAKADGAEQQRKATP